MSTQVSLKKGQKIGMGLSDLAKTPSYIEELGYRYVERFSKNLTIETWLAQDKKSSHPVVIKTLNIQELGEFKPFDLFEREAEVLKTLNHPQIPRYIGYFQKESHLITIMEHIEGMNLQKWLAANNRFTESELMTFTDSLFELLKYLHSLNPPVVHRDIKPSNIMLRSDKTPVLIDFGSVKYCFDRSKSTTTTVGTFGYMAPELLMGKSSPESDLYSVGTTLLKIMTGLEPEELPQTDELEFHLKEIDLFPNWKPILAALTSRKKENRRKAVTLFYEIKRGSKGLAGSSLKEDRNKLMVLDDPAGEIIPSEQTLFKERGVTITPHQIIIKEKRTLYYTPEEIINIFSRKNKVVNLAIVKEVISPLKAGEDLQEALGKQQGLKNKKLEATLIAASLGILTCLLIAFKEGSLYLFLFIGIPLMIALYWIIMKTVDSHFLDLETDNGRIRLLSSPDLNFLLKVEKGINEALEMLKKGGGE